MLQTRLPYDRKLHILISTIGATIAAYRITKDRTRACQAAWMAVEDKHTALHSINAPLDKIATEASI